MRLLPGPAQDAGGAAPAAVVEPRTSPAGEPNHEKMSHAMSNEPPVSRAHEQWARFRFSVVGPWLAAPPERGQLQAQLEKLSAQPWRHPISGQWVQFGLSTIQRWDYIALEAKQDPVAALRRKTRSDQGQHPTLSLPLRELLFTQYRQQPRGSYQLHTKCGQFNYVA